MFGFVGESHAHDYFEVISFYNSKDKTETEISQKRSKGIKNCN